MTIERTSNLLGAVALAVADRIHAAAEHAVGHGGEAAGALALIGLVPGLSNNMLCKILGLSHPGAVRLVDKLVADGLVERRPASDARAIALHLTEAGMAKRSDVLSGREAALCPLVGKLTAKERGRLDDLMAALLRLLVLSENDACATCRLCDDQACDDCPVEALPLVKA